MKKLFTSLGVFLLCVPLSAQSDCSSASVIDGAKMSVDVPVVPDVQGKYENWFSYTAPADKTVLLALTNPSTTSSSFRSYYECPDNNESPVTTGSDELLTVLSPGQRLFVCMAVYGSPLNKLNVAVKEVTQGGASCEEALTLKEGYNFVPLNRVDNENATWFKYTPTETGEIFIQSTKSFSGSIFGACGESEGTYFYSNYVNSKLQTFEYPVTKGVDLFFQFKNWDIFEINTSFRVVNPGDKSTNPLPSVLGLNECKATKAGDHWYSFTPEKTGYLTVSACDFDDIFSGQAFLYEASYTGYHKSESGACPGGGAGFYLSYKVEAGTPYLFNVKLSLEMESDFNFEVAIEEPKPGDECSLPIAAAEQNHCNPLKNEVWYSFEPTKDCFVKITTKGDQFDGYLKVFKECNLPLMVNNSNVYANSLNGDCELKFVAQKGVSYLLQCYFNTLSPINFKIEEVDIQPGDLCSNPIIAKAGEQRIDNLKGGEVRWYKYTAAAAGWLNVSVCDSKWTQDAKVEFRSQCEDYMSQEFQQSECESGNGFNYRVNIAEGETKLISLTAPASFEGNLVFDILEAEAKIGELCEKPLPAVLGKNALTVVEGTAWYEYVTPKSGFYKISSKTLPFDYSVTPNPTIRYKLGNCSSPEYGVNFEWEMNQYLTEVYIPEGTPLLIKMVLGGIRPNIDFEIESRDAYPGEVCSTPIEVTGEVINHSASPKSVWYTFNLPAKGEVKIGQCGNYHTPMISVYKECPLNNEDPLAFSSYCSDYSSTSLSTILESGDYIVKVDYRESTSISLSYTTGTDWTEVPEIRAIYPNPTRDHFFVNCAGMNPERIAVDIMTFEGELLSRSIFNGEATPKVDVRNLAQGVYLVKVSDGTSSFVNKMIIK